jgi:coproporphyrinogen III oxidase
MEQLVRSAQSDICAALEEVERSVSGPNGPVFEEKLFRREADHPVQGGGIERVISGGKVFEKGGLNTSVSHGRIGAAQLEHLRPNHVQLQQAFGESAPIPADADAKYFAASMSMVIHPASPMIPTVHLNYRYFELDVAGEPELISWFGGGADLTPSYVDDSDAAWFHSTLKDACDKTDVAFYPRFKTWCDNYFVIKHRQETRGVGGIFFDDLSSSDLTASMPSAKDSEVTKLSDEDKLFQFVSDCAYAFLPSYVPIVSKNLHTDYTAEQKQWQQLRRGRYAEFNLMYDRGTHFGLSLPNPRTEAILMSLPLTCSWEYNHETQPGSEEERTIDILKNPRDWVL